MTPATLTALSSELLEIAREHEITGHSGEVMQKAAAILEQVAGADELDTNDCDDCCGKGWNWEEHQVAERATDVQEFKVDCETCHGRGYLGPDAEAREALCANQPGQGAEPSGSEVRQQVFALCEDTEGSEVSANSAHSSAAQDFMRGRKFEAKSIRRAIGTWFIDETNALTAQSGEGVALYEALKFAEAGLADIGDADREPGDDLAWCEARAAQSLPRVRAAIAAYEAKRGGVPATDSAIGGKGA